jgi:hypothetical protein
MANRINLQFQEFGPVVQAGLPKQYERPDRESDRGVSFYRDANRLHLGLRIEPGSDHCAGGKGR